MAIAYCWYDVWLCARGPKSITKSYSYIYEFVPRPPNEILQAFQVVGTLLPRNSNKAIQKKKQRQQRQKPAEQYRNYSISDNRLTLVEKTNIIFVFIHFYLRNLKATANLSYANTVSA